MAEYQASSKHEILTSGWIIEIKLYSSIVTEKNTQVIDLNNVHAASNGETSDNDLCYRNEIEWHESDYFESAKNK